MSSVTRIENDRSEHGDRGRGSGVRGRVAGSGSGPADGRVPLPVLVERVERVSPVARRDRTRELLRITGIDGWGLGLITWTGTRERLISTKREDRVTLVLNLEAICRAERQRGIAGHWSYDKGRHDAIFKLMKAEQAELEAMGNAQ